MTLEEKLRHIRRETGYGVTNPASYQELNVSESVKSKLRALYLENWLSNPNAKILYINLIYNILINDNKR